MTIKRETKFNGSLARKMKGSGIDFDDDSDNKPTHIAIGRTELPSSLNPVTPTISKPSYEASTV